MYGSFDFSQNLYVDERKEGYRKWRATEKRLSPQEKEWGRASRAKSLEIQQSCA
jgi:hypothetical protein